jgi:hypothetical protein
MIIPQGFANCILLFQVEGDSEIMQTAMGVDVSEAGGDFEAVGAKFGGEFGNVFIDDISDQATLVGVDVVVGQDGGDPITVNVPFSDTGAGGAFPLPPNCAVLLRKHTGLGGRAGRGRMFIPGFQLTGNTQPNGTINGSLVTEWNNDALAWRLALESDTVPPAIPPVLFHAIDTVPPTPITALTIDPKVATQRRRLRP